MKLHLPSSLRAALLACLAFAPSLQASTYMAEGVDPVDVSNSTRFYDGGKGCYWTYWGTPKNGAQDLLQENKDYQFLGQLYERVPTAYQGRQPSFSVNAFANLTDDANTCWAYTTGNILQYWQTYYGVFSYQSDQLAHGHTYSKEYLDDLGGTQSLEINMLFYDNWKNEGGNIHSAAPWYFGGEVFISAYMRPGYVQGGYFKEYFSPYDEYAEYLEVDSSVALDEFSGYVARGLGYTRSGTSYTKTAEGLITYLGLTSPVGGHAITCYGFDTDASGNVVSLRVTNSDDLEYELFTVYVKLANGQYYLYTDAACTKLWKYAGENWYIDEISYIRTPEVLKDMLAEYSDSSKPLYWNGGATEWGGEAGQYTTEELPTAATGWEATAGTGTEHAGQYASYYDDTRQVVFDDRAAGRQSSIYLAADVATAGMTVDNARTPYTFNGNGLRLDATKLTKGGSEKLVFNAVALHAETTDIWGGRVELTGGTHLTGASVALAGAAGVGLRFNNATATLTGNLTVGSGATLEFDTNTTLTAAAVTCSAGSTLVLAVGNANASTPVLGLTGNMVIDGAVTLNLTATRFSADLTYTLVSTSGTLGVADLSNVSISGTAYADSEMVGVLRLGADGKSLLLAFEEEGNLYWEAGNGSWNATHAAWSAEDGKAEALSAFTADSNACFTHGSASISVDAPATVAKMLVDNGSYSFTNSANISIGTRLRLRNNAKVTMDVAPTLGRNAQVEILGTGSSLTIAKGDLRLASFTNEGTLSLRGGSLTLTADVAKGGRVDVSGDLSLASGVAGSFSRVSADSVQLGRGATLSVSDALATDSIALGSVGSSAAISAGRLTASSLDIELSTAALENLGSLGLGYGDSVELLSLRTASAAALSIGGSDRVSYGSYDYLIGMKGSGVVLTAYEKGIIQWTSVDALWDDAADLGNHSYDSSSTVGLLGQGTAKIGLGGTVSVRKVVVDSGNKDYELTGNGTLQLRELAINEGGLSVSSGSTLLARRVTLGEGGSFSNHGTTEVSGTMLAKGVDLVNTGTLKVGNGSQLGRLSGGGMLEVAGQATAESLGRLGGLVIATGASLRVDEAVAVPAAFRNGGLLESGTKLSFAAPVSGGGNVAAPWIVLAGRGNSFGAMSASTLEFRGTPGAASMQRSSMALLEADSLTMPGGALSIIVGDTALEEGQYLLASIGDSVEGGSITLDADCYRSFLRNRLMADIVTRGGNIYLELTDRKAFYENAARSANGRAGGRLLDAAFDRLDPQFNSAAHPDLAAVLNALDITITSGSAEAADRLAAAVGGASIATLGQAAMGDVTRQLRAIRNRTTTMGVDPAVRNEGMPYVNAWINAEGDYRRMDACGTDPGYTLSSWGGTVGFDVDATPSLTFGFACSALYGDLSASAADVADGELDSCYGTAFARYSSGGWVHTFVVTGASLDMSLDRTVHYGGGSYRTNGSTSGAAWGALYELAYTIPVDEDGSVCWQPVANVSYVHATVKGYTETGSDAALRADEQAGELLTFALGARMQAVVDESIYNRTSLLELRALLKADLGERRGEADVAFAALPAARSTMRTSEYGALGVEIGASLTIPISLRAGELFLDASAEIRNGYSNVNGTVGYRIQF